MSYREQGEAAADKPWGRHSESFWIQPSFLGNLYPFKPNYMPFLLLLCCCLAFSAGAQELFRFPAATGQTRWSSFENPTAAKGGGGKENKGAKGHPAEHLRPGKTIVLLDVRGPGTVQRIWMTLSERSPHMLRSLRLDMYWDGASKPAVSVPVGDFFGLGLGRTTPFQNALFSNPEGRSFNSYIPMPFRKGARITITNESATTALLFYDINFVTLKAQPADALYFHAFWTSNKGTALGEDFTILPQLPGRGRFLGCNLGVIADSVYGKSWWGEGEVKIYLDGDGPLPTLAGTGTEDYIGTGWGQGPYAHNYQGCPIADTANRQWVFYRYHIPDPVFFHSGIRVTIQQMGGDTRDAVRRLVKGGARLIPVTVALPDGFVNLFEQRPVPQLSDDNFPDGWTNFYRLDNYSSTAYFYLDAPVSALPVLRPLSERVEGLLPK
jgi:hypothetical protein